jgi:hypothetical protein
VEVNHNSHAPVKVVQLRSADTRYLLEFVLKVLTEAKHQDWHSYELHMIDTRSGKRASLTSTEDYTLFLDKVIEPEVPALCNGLRTAIGAGTPYRFEPADERDFRLDLDVNHATQAIHVKLQYDRVPISEEYGWPMGLIVDRVDLLCFVNDLESAFVELFADSNAN